MTAFTMLALAVSVAGRVLSASLVLDLVALWPLLVPVVVCLVAMLLRPDGRMAAGAPLVVLTWLLAGLALHLAAWDRLPSSAADVTSDALFGVAEASVTVDLAEGRLSLEPDALFTVSMERIGGRTGTPAVELVEAEHPGVIVAAGSAGGWFRFGGVMVGLPSGPGWDLELGAPVVELDLVGLDVRSLVVRGDAGTVRLGAVTEATSVVISGPLDVVIPADVAASVTGSARTPSDWTSVGDVSRAPAGGDGWEIAVEPGSGSVAISNP